jgi:hypothetical protein
LNLIVDLSLVSLNFYLPFRLVTGMLSLMTELEEDPDWLTADENKTEEEDSNSYVAESSIDRVACALGGKIMLRPLLNTCHEMLIHNGMVDTNGGD